MSRKEPMKMAAGKHHAPEVLYMPMKVGEYVDEQFAGQYFQAQATVTKTRVDACHQSAAQLLVFGKLITKVAEVGKHMSQILWRGNLLKFSWRELRLMFDFVS
jgi:hypothetical protein